MAPKLRAVSEDLGFGICSKRATHRLPAILKYGAVSSGNCDACYFVARFYSMSLT